jgi:uncharacterized protein YpmB
MKNQKNNMKKILILIAITILIILGVWLLGTRQSEPVAEDSTAAIAQELEAISVDGLEEEFKGIDADLQTL